MRARLLGVGIAAMLMLSVLAPMAYAQNDLGTIGPANATVGEKIDCKKAGGVTPTGRGLTYPSPKDVQPHTANKDRSYRFVGPITSIGFGNGTIDVCGHITSVAGVGPRCFMSKGYGGRGFARFPGATVKLSNITWKVSGVGTLPITGRADLWDGANKSKESRIYSIVQAQGGAIDCANGWPQLGTDKPQGTTNFQVFGVYAIANGTGPQWNDVTDIADPKNDGRSGPTNLWGDKKERDDNEGK